MVTLREIQESDLELIRTWRSSDAVNKFMYTNANPTYEQQKRWFEKVQNDLTCKYWVIDFNNKPLGVANLLNISKVFNSCEWAFYLGDTSVRGQGIGSKVEYQVIEYVFNAMGLNKLKCEVINSNEKVIKMHEGFGFRREAYYRDHFLKNGIYQDVVGLALLKKDWDKIKNYTKTKIYG